MSDPERRASSVLRARAFLSFLSRPASRASRESPQGSPVPDQRERCSPPRSPTPTAAEDGGAGVAAKDHQRPESPRQGLLQSKDLGATGLAVQAEKSLSNVAMSEASSASSFLLGTKEKEAHSYIEAFLDKDTKRGKPLRERPAASKVLFLASICTLCRAWLQGTYLPSMKAVSKLLDKIEVLGEKASPQSMDAVMWRQAKLAFTAMSTDCEDLLGKDLCPIVRDICSLEPAEEDSPSASFDAQILTTLDSLLEVVTHGASPSSNNNTVMVILEVLMPFLRSPWVSQRQRAVGSIISLSQYFRPSLMVEDLPHADNRPFLFNKMPLPFLGTLMGLLTLCYAEKDEKISHGAAQALSVFHRVILLRQGYAAACEDPMLQVERESACTFWPKDSIDPEMLFGSSFLEREKNDFILTVLENMADPRISDTQLIAKMLEGVLNNPCLYLIKMDLVVQTIYNQLRRLRQKSPQDILKSTLLQVATLDPPRVAVTLLQVSHGCNNTTRAMWNTLACKPSLVEALLRMLLVASNQCTRLQSSTGRCRCRDLLAVSSAMQEIFLVPSSRCYVQLVVDELFMSVLFQLFCSLDGTQKGCCYRSSKTRILEHPSLLRTTVSTAQALFQCLGGASLVKDIERQGAWDMLVSTETYHTGVAVLMRVLRREIPECCTAVSEQVVVGLLQRWAMKEVASLTVFVELLDYTDLEHVDGQVLSVLEVHLKSQNMLLRRLAVQSLVMLSGRPKKAAMLQGLLPELMKLLLQDTDCELTMAALTVLSNVLPVVNWRMAGPMALELVKTLLPLFENESSAVQERSMLLWRAAMEVAVQPQNKQMRMHVRWSLMPLFFHLHDKDHKVAQASWEALLAAAKYLKQTKIRKLLETKQAWRVGESLLAEGHRRQRKYLEQSLPYLRSPQECMRDAAVRFLGLAGQQLSNRRQEKLQVIYKALEDAASDSSLWVSSLAAQTLRNLKAAVAEPPSRRRLPALSSWLRRA